MWDRKSLPWFIPNNVLWVPIVVMSTVSPLEARVGSVQETGGPELRHLSYIFCQSCWGGREDHAPFHHLQRPICGCLCLIGEEEAEPQSRGLRSTSLRCKMTRPQLLACLVSVTTPQGL